MGDEQNTLLAWVCGGFGALLLLLVASALREAVAMKRWPVAKGRVLSSKVEEYRAHRQYEPLEMLILNALTGKS